MHRSDTQRAEFRATTPDQSARRRCPPISYCLSAATANFTRNTSVCRPGLPRHSSTVVASSLHTCSPVISRSFIRWDRYAGGTGIRLYATTAAAGTTSAAEQTNRPGPTCLWLSHGRARHAHAHRQTTDSPPPLSAHSVQKTAASVNVPRWAGWVRENDQY